MLAIDVAELPNPKRNLCRESLFMPRIFTAGKDALEAPLSMPGAQVCCHNNLAFKSYKYGSIPPLMF